MTCIIPRRFLERDCFDLMGARAHFRFKKLTSTQAHSLAVLVTLTQLYLNSDSTACEAVYRFPIDDNPAVVGLQAEVLGGRIVVGEIKERQRARQIYDEALARKDGAYLLESVASDVLEARWQCASRV